MKDFSKILRYAKPYRKGILFAFLCLAVTSVITLVLPLIVRNMINVVVVEKNAAALNNLTLDIIGVIAFQMVFGITQNYILGFVGNRMTADFPHDRRLSNGFVQSYPKSVPAVFPGTAGGRNHLPDEQRHLGDSKSVGVDSRSGFAAIHHSRWWTGHRFLSELETVGFDSDCIAAVDVIRPHFRQTPAQSLGAGAGSDSAYHGCVGRSNLIYQSGQVLQSRGIRKETI
jgi:hypothetical protein